MGVLYLGGRGKVPLHFWLELRYFFYLWKAKDQKGKTDLHKYSKLIIIINKLAHHDSFEFTETRDPC